MFDPLDNLIQYYSEVFNVSPELARNMIRTESSMNPKAISKKGAQGLSQMMPITQREMGVTNPYDPEQSIKGGLGYYAKQREEFGPVGALYAYNWGPGNYRGYLNDTQKGKKRTIPEETRKYVDKLSAFVDMAPMNLQGKAGVPPEIMPVSPPSAPPQAPQPENTEMEDYDQMKMFNPYIQMALGILAGNTGSNKREAFANALGGGLMAGQGALRTMSYDKQVQAQNKRMQREDEEYELMKGRNKMLMDYAAGKLQDPNLSPEERPMYELMSKGMGKDAISLYNTMGDNKYQRDLLDLKRDQLEMKANTGDKSQRIPLGYPEGHNLSGWSRDEKGNLYDPKGIEVTGDKKTWATDDPSIPYKNWKDKSNPNMIIPPQNFEAWQDDYGGTLKESLTPAEASEKGLKYYTSKQITDRNISRSDMKDLEIQVERLFGKEAGVFPNLPTIQADAGLASRFMEGLKNKLWRESGAATDPVSKNVRLYGDWAKAFLSRLSKAQGEVGVLTQQDVERVKGLLAELTPSYSEGKIFPITEEEAFEKMAEIYRKFADRGVRSENLDLFFGAKQDSPGMVTKSGRRLVD